MKFLITAHYIADDQPSQEQLVSVRSYEEASAIAQRAFPDADCVTVQEQD
jgi:hypothetical protein